ncbi:hypothetical protein BDZ94DRAFT_723977 [Collybia nuda]|uniref:F-box domain-containing protein n=1 Tax=Collybia nuda TaxID=64659 RepID=A0A9P6CHR2_9AGAR|nr:hypothetical protein BDZ94DRAFT_723977 [Collybia nuda]
MRGGFEDHFLTNPLSSLIGDFGNPDSSDIQENNLSPSPANFFLIPPELVNLIIGHCDLDELRTSSLVCRGWRVLTIHTLFSKVSLSPTTALAFVEFLRSKYGALVRGSVQLLSLTSGSDFAHSSISDTTLEALSALLQPSHLKLTIHNNAGSKRVDGLFWWGRQSKDLSGFQRSFKTVTNLELNMFSDTFIEVAKMVSSFPILENLTISGVWLPADYEEEKDDEIPVSDQIDQELPEKHISLPCTLHTIRLPSLFPSSIFLHWLHSHENPPQISTLILRGIFTSSLDLTSTCLRTLGETLKNLTITGLMAQNVRHGELDLSRNTDLRTLALHNPWTQSSEIAFRVLSQVTSSSLEEFELSAWDPRGDPKDMTYWPQLDSLLAEPQFSCLRRITINVNMATRHAVEGRLPIMTSRGLVQFRNSMITY